MPDFPFPFVGAGEASYFEWASVHVEFRREPSAEERAAIAARVPPPLQDSVDFVGSHLAVASDQFAHVAMAFAYGDDSEAVTFLEEGGRFFFASDDQVHAFNLDTDAWLFHCHDICPILVAFRAEDAESGGTELSAWHAWSLARVADLLDPFRGVLTSSEGEDGARAHMVRGMLALVVADEIDIPEEFAEWLPPARAEPAGSCSVTSVLPKWTDSEELRRLLVADTTQTLERLGTEVDLDDDEQRQSLLAVADLLIGAPALDNKVKFILATVAAPLRHQAPDPAPEALVRHAEAVMAATKTWVTNDRHFANRISDLGYNLAMEGSFPAAIDLFDLLVDVDGLKMGTYCNALWVICRGNNNLPLQPARARRFLSGCVPHGPENPAIFYNAACVHMELGEHDMVLRSLSAAIENGYASINAMKNEPLFAPIADTPEFVAVFATP